MTAEDAEVRWRELMRESLKGNESSYRQLLNEISPVLKRFYIKKVASQTTAEDLTQECLIAIHKSRATWDPKRSFQAWMFAIARYKVIDYFRAQERLVKTAEIDEERDQIDEQTDLTAENIKDLVEEGLSQLPDEMKRALVLTKIDGYSTEEAAKQEDVAPGAMRVRISRAYKKLRESIEKEMN